MAVEASRFTGPNNDIRRPDNVEIPPLLEREQPYRIAVIAEGAITPLGLSAEETWENFRDGRSGIRTHEYKPYTDPRNVDGRNLPPQIQTTTAATIEGFDPITMLEGVLAYKELKYQLDPYALYALAASFEVMKKIKTHDGTPLLVPRFDNEGEVDEDRNWIINNDLVHPAHTAVIIGSGFGGGDVSVEVMDLLRQGKIPTGDHMMRALLDRAASSVSKAFGIKGGAEGTVAACATSGKAIVDLMRKIALGEVEFGIAGGVEGVLGKPIASAMFDTFPALDRGKNPKDVSRSLYKVRRGFTMGGGAGVFGLADPDWARRHGIKILYEIVGHGDTSDAEDNTRPTGRDGEVAMREANRRADRNGKTEGKVLFAGHLTATQTGDGLEMLHAANALEEYKDRRMVVAPKRLLAHGLGSAGAQTQLIAGKALQEGIAPGTPIYEEVADEAYGWDIPQESRPEPELTDALMNEFGFGGANVSRRLRKVS